MANTDVPKSIKAILGLSAFILFSGAMIGLFSYITVRSGTAGYTTKTAGEIIYETSLLANTVKNLVFVLLAVFALIKSKPEYIFMALLSIFLLTTISAVLFIPMGLSYFNLTLSLLLSAATGFGLFRFRKYGCGA